MKRIRASVLTGFIACGLLLLNLGGWVFSFTADVPAVSYSAAPVNDDGTDDAGLTDVACVPSTRREAVAFQSVPANHSSPVTRHFFPSLVARHSSLTWQFTERAAASPRAPSLTS